MPEVQKVKATLYKISHLPLMRIMIGTLVCGIAMIATNALLKMMLGIEGDFPRIIRWILSTTVLVSTYYYFFRYFEGREVAELKRQYFLRETVTGLFVGIGLVGLIVLILYIFGFYAVKSMGEFSVLPLLFLFFVTAAALEEVIFRGIIYRIIEDTWGTKSALIVSALLFGSAHLFNDGVDIFSVISVASGGLFLGLLYSLKGRLWLPIAFHAGWNWTLGSLGTVVSGNEDLPTFLEVTLTGPEFMTGGAFGLENSIITIVLILLSSGIVTTMLIKKRQTF